MGAPTPIKLRLLLQARGVSAKRKRIRPRQITRVGLTVLFTENGSHSVSDREEPTADERGRYDIQTNCHPEIRNAKGNRVAREKACSGNSTLVYEENRHRYV